MKPVTTREAQHHLSKVIAMVEAGEEVVLTRRGEKTIRLVHYQDDDIADVSKEWELVVQNRDEKFENFPAMKENAVIVMREEETR